MKLIIGFFTCFALLSGYAHGSNTGWLWYNYFPWVYSEDEGNWLYIQAQGDHMLAYSARDKVWREFESKASERSKYFKALGAREGIIKDSSGLFYEYMDEGSGEKPTMSDEVTVHYHGTLVDGTVFDSSVQRGSPSSFPMNGVIAGFFNRSDQVETRWKDSSLHSPFPCLRRQSKSRWGNQTRRHTDL